MCLGIVYRFLRTTLNIIIRKILIHCTQHVLIFLIFVQNFDSLMTVVCFIVTTFNKVEKVKIKDVFMLISNCHI